MSRDKLETIFQDRHHAQAQKIHLDNSKISAILLVPLNYISTRHGCTFNRHNVIQLSLADNHATGVLTEMARQILYAHAEF